MVRFNAELDFGKRPLYSSINLLLYLTLAFVIYQMIRYLLGGSWDIPAINTSLTAGIVLYLIRMESRLSYFMGEIKEFKRTTIANLNSINSKVLGEQ